MAEGTRTPDHRDHNPGLYQLSYRHRGRHIVSPAAAPPEGRLTVPGHGTPARYCVIPFQEATVTRRFPGLPPSVTSRSATLFSAVASRSAPSGFTSTRT